MDPIALKNQWETEQWATRIFQFLLAVANVNVRLLALHIHGHNPITVLNFRRLLAKEHIMNPYLPSERKTTPRFSKKCKWMISWSRCQISAHGKA
eukprot:scaffold884_cov202-Amphora_coffeaeformis.AAC.2